MSKFNESRTEFLHYKDGGCKYAVSCLECHLPRCFHDGWKKEQRPETVQRNKEIQALIMNGLKRKELARRYGVSERTIGRALND